ncbi:MULTISPECIES: Rha family transcriptional regulator [unclassified Pseudomonas]|uniref:Rha family transcriptional regulator n=1 Tax=unclassified Pseudomonas TaxID=196821 RepID=UPI002E807CDB|nr:phage regulatory protein/antirepressor Ant [Pseudomonas sp. 10C3]MEE3507767.1 phage regulatory protein/antirepressor Ant [Pseudomonas sp. 10C3]
MNTIVAPGNTVTMSSREIAELCNKEHKNVKRDIQKVLTELNLDALSFERIYLDDSNRRQTEYFLPRDLTETLLTGYSIPLRHRVVTRLRELENAVPTAGSIPTSLPEALRLAADQAEQNQQLQKVIQDQAPQVRALATLTFTHGSICITDAAKHIGMRPRELFSWLKNNRWIYRRSSGANWSAFQSRLSAGLLEHKLVILNKDKEEESMKVVEHVLVTRKGLTVLAQSVNGDSA